MNNMDAGSQSAAAQSLILPIFETGEDMEIKVKKVFYDKKSAYQDIKVIDTEEFGRCLIINDSMQAAESDHDIYDREILLLLRPEDLRIAILGGGDGYVAQRALEMNPALHIDLAELDPEIIYCAKEYLGQRVFDDERLYLHVGDALAYMEDVIQRGGETYDGLVCDFNVDPITEKEKGDFIQFYENLVACAYDVTKKGGWVAFQAGDTDVDREKYINRVELLHGIMSKKFVNITRSDIMIPSYGERDSFLFAWKQ